MKYALPIITNQKVLRYCDIVDANNESLDFDDIARDLTEFYALKARQEKCGETGHIMYGLTSATPINHFAQPMYNTVRHACCPKCGADLTKGQK